MTRNLFVLHGDEMRRRAVEAVARAAPESRVTVQGPRRTLPQNAMMWAMLEDVAEQREHCGRRYDASAWKAIFLRALGKEVEWVPGLDGELIPLGLSSRDLDIGEMADLIDFMLAAGAEWGIRWSESNG